MTYQDDVQVELGPLSALTSGDNFFEDFQVDQTIRHARGKDMEGTENVVITNMVMNTAQGHFNTDAMRKLKEFPVDEIIVYGGVTASLVLGLSSQDCTQNALRELGLNNLSFKFPVLHGDTIYAYSRVIDKTDGDQEDAGIITFRHWGVNQRDKIVCEVDRIALIKRRSHWASK